MKKYVAKRLVISVMTLLIILFVLFLMLSFMLNDVVGDAFAPRNPYALDIDFEQEPPRFVVNEHHWAATWLLDPRAPKVEMPSQLKRRIALMRAEGGGEGD